MNSKGTWVSEKRYLYPALVDLLAPIRFELLPASQDNILRGCNVRKIIYRQIMYVYRDECSTRLSLTSVSTVTVYSIIESRVLTGANTYARLTSQDSVLGITKKKNTKKKKSLIIFRKS